MTPEQAQAILDQAYAEKMAGRDRTKALVQKELRDAAWQVVLDAHKEEIRKEIDSEWAQELLKRG